MNTRPLILICFTAFAICNASIAVSAPAALQQSPYNAGVDAFRNQDYRLARKHWEIAAVHDRAAQNNLAFLLFNGHGGPKDAARAILLWRKAALSGHSEAQRFLGIALEEGKGLKKDLVEAYAWFKCSISTAKETAGRDTESAKELADRASSDLSRLEPQLTQLERKKAESLAEKCVVPAR